MTPVLSDMSLDIFPGEVHAIVGENGAGKSTMIKIMTGIYAPSAGALRIDGADVVLNGPQDARREGVTAMYQEPMVFPDLDVAENIFISSTAEGWWHRPADLHHRSRELLSRIGMDVDVSELASQLTLAEQQAVEIARALSQDVRVLIMDEPTAALSAHEAAQLRSVARRLAEDGVAVIYITHRLEEVFEIAARVTVIRDGEHISTRSVSEVTADGMITEMVGREIDHFFAHVPSRKRPDTLLAVTGLGRDARFRDVGFSLRSGEILCLAGLVGARRTDVALALFGIAPADAGTIVFDGAAFAPNCARDAMQAGIAYVTEDRRKLGLALPMTLRENITLATLDNFLSSGGIIDQRREAETAERYRSQLNIRAPDTEAQTGLLSGGNQQKVLLAKWLNLEPKLLILDEPTRGIDVGTKADVHSLIRRFVADGGAALVISSDLPEVLAIGDRILVMREGRMVGIIDNSEADQEIIMAMATGQSAATQAGAA